MENQLTPPETSVRAPRWATTLWSVFPGDEAELGDLIEAYRDSIYPSRGALRANLWLLREVAGCILRADSTMNLRNWILAGLALCILTLVVSVMRYGALIGSSDPHRTRNLIAIGTVFGFYAYAAIWRTRPSSREAETILRLGASWGVATGILWMLTYVSANILRSTNLIFPWTVLALIAFCLPFLAGAHGAIKFSKVSCGLRVGFWCGLISGLMAFLSLAAIGYILAFVPGLPGAEIPSAGHPYTALEYQRLNVFDALGGGLAHLIGFGGLFASAAGVIGGCIGLLLERTGRMPTVPERN